MGKEFRGSKIEQLIDHSVWAKERQRKKKTEVNWTVQSTA